MCFKPQVEEKDETGAFFSAIYLLSGQAEDAAMNRAEESRGQL